MSEKTSPNNAAVRVSGSSSASSTWNIVKIALQPNQMEC